MNPNTALATTFGVGILGAGLAINGYFDGRLEYCQLTPYGGCIIQSVPEWVQLGEVSSVRRVPGASGVKLIAAAVATGAFFRAMVKARQMLTNEEKRLQLQAVQQELELRKVALLAESDLETFKHQVWAETGEAIGEILEPFQEVEAKTAEQIEQTPLALAPSESQETPSPQPVVETAASADEPPKQTPPAIPTTAKGNEPGLKILDAIVGTTRSTVNAAATGTGKSVSLAYILQNFFKRFPRAEVWAIAQKNDDFCGLARKGRVTLFDVLKPEESLQTIDNVWDIFDKRRRVTEHERGEFKDKPIRLILADWHSVYDSCRDEKWFQPYLKKLSTIITVGRELNVCLLIDTQSFNLDALGLAKDTNIRHNLNILSQGFTWIDPDGETQGDYGVLENIIKNPHVIHEPGLREELRNQLRELKIESQQLGLPIIFSTIEPPRLAILPDIRHYKPGQEMRVKLEGYSPEQLNRILSLEFDIDLPQSQTSEAPITNHLAKQTLKSWFQGKGWVKVGEARSMCKDLRKLTKDADEVRVLILELVREESAEFDSAQNTFLVS